MSARDVFRHRRRDEVLTEAVNRSLPIGLTHRTDVGWISYTSQLLSILVPGETMAIAAPVPRRAYAATALPLDQTLGVAFRQGHKKYMFSSQLEAPTSGAPNAAFTLSWPEEVQQVRRRAYERVAPPPGWVIPVRFWCVAQPVGGAPLEQRMRYGELEDLSAGGMRVLVSDTDGLDHRGTYCCLFAPRPQAAPLVLEAVFRHREAGVGGRSLLGFAFVGLEATPEGRNILGQLARIVSQFQRAQAACRT